MRKVISKISKILATFVFASMFIFADVNVVEAAPSSIKLGSATHLPGYIAGVKYNIKTVLFVKKFTMKKQKPVIWQF